MPFPNITQPEIIEIELGLRLKRFDWNIDKMLEGYHDPVVYQNSEGIFDQDKIPDMDYIKSMCRYLDGAGELYFIQALENGEYVSVGDVTVKPENPPIAIWEEKYRGVGIGQKVMTAVIARLSALGYKKITGSTVYKWNLASQKMHERLGFTRTGETERDYIYEYTIKEA
ncbi:MAG: GNAT family N-acetyltransferase [Oscillospiraceae bacterium]|nr:GNAT family N-acetyltransferase [Ruminococcus sp.]MCD8346279.1 GNAT family N-acetyltransferase [Oscillospiraceae bacterium]